MSIIIRDGPNFKEPPAEERPDYLRAVRELECVICQNFGEFQMSPTTAHHPICGRHSQRKRPDITAVPLCDGHHQGNFDKSKLTIHHDRAAWVEAYGEDTLYIAQTQDRLAHILETDA